MRLRTWLWGAALIPGAGCGVVNPGSLVTGTWGGRWIGLDAGTVAEPRLDFHCSQWRLSGPLVLDQMGSFEGLAVAVWASWPGGAAGSLLLSGEVRGDQMTLNVAHVDPHGVRSDPVAHHLRRARTPTSPASPASPSAQG